MRRPVGKRDLGFMRLDAGMGKQVQILPVIDIGDFSRDDIEHRPADNLAAFPAQVIFIGRIAADIDPLFVLIENGVGNRVHQRLDEMELTLHLGLRLLPAGHDLKKNGDAVLAGVDVHFVPVGIGGNSEMGFKMNGFLPPQRQNVVLFKDRTDGFGKRLLKRPPDDLLPPSFQQTFRGGIELREHHAPIEHKETVADELENLDGLLPSRSPGRPEIPFADSTFSCFLRARLLRFGFFSSSVLLLIGLYLKPVSPTSGRPKCRERSQTCPYSSTFPLIIDRGPLFCYHESSPIPAVATGIRAIPETVALPHEEGERA